MRWVIRIAVGVLLIAVLAIGYCVYRGISDSLHAEHVLHAALITAGLLDDYVAQHNGEWPHSWTDLEHSRPGQGGIFEWPKDSLEMQKYVEIDFRADPRVLAKQTADEFDAIRPIGPYYPFRDRWQIAHLMQTIREHSTQ